LAGIKTVADDRDGDGSPETVRERVELRAGESTMAKPFELSVKAVILDEQGRCLLIRRSRRCRNFVGQWEWPGGKVDPGEEFAAALVREAREETSLEVEITGLAGAAQWEMATVNVILLCLEARRIGGDVHLSEEHDDFAWVPLAQLPEWKLSAQMQTFMLEYGQKKEARK
jgi:8-oxo-dGTP diphosphatase